MLAREEVRIKVKVRNNLLYKLIMDGGWVHRNSKINVAGFSRDSKLCKVSIEKLLNFRGSPFCENGEYTPSAKKISSFFKVDVEKLFPEMLYSSIHKPNSSRAITLEQLPRIKYDNGTLISELKQWGGDINVEIQGS